MAQSVNIFQQINNYFPISFTEIILCFLFFFVVGYLIYATLYAATGSVVDNESDSQQYTMPVTIPLLLAIILIPTISTNPNGQLAFWFSMIPLTSPIVMMVRLRNAYKARQQAIRDSILTAERDRLDSLATLPVSAKHAHRR